MAQPSVQAIEWGTGLSDAWTSVANFVPKLLAFLVVFLIGWLIAKAVSKAVGLLLDKIGFAGLIERAGLNRFLQSANITPVALLTKLIYYFILLIALQLALSAFGPSNPVSEIVNKIVLFLPKAIIAVVIVIIVAAIATAVKKLLEEALGGLSYGDLLAKIVAGFIIALGAIAALAQVGIGTTVTTPLLVTVLATIGGVIVVGAGGGLINPMRDRWEAWLTQLSDDTKKVKEDREAKKAALAAAPTSAFSQPQAYSQEPPQGYSPGAGYAQPGQPSGGYDAGGPAGGYGPGGQPGPAPQGYSDSPYSQDPQYAQDPQYNQDPQYSQDPQYGAHRAPGAAGSQSQSYGPPVYGQQPQPGQGYTGQGYTEQPGQGYPEQPGQGYTEQPGQGFADPRDPRDPRFNPPPTDEQR